MPPLLEQLRAPAKINLTLRVTGRRADGYHLLDSIVLPVDFYDELEIRVTSSSHPSVHVSVASEAVPGGPANLAYRAAEAFLAQLKQPATVRVHLQKRIPVGGGLGGGSSDAAAVLLALNRLFHAPFAPEQLAAIGLRIGADVPFFVHGRPARMTGIGEQLTPLDLPRPLALVLCWDHCSVSTKDVYARVALSLTSPAPLSNILPLIGNTPSWDCLVNDLEAAAAQIHPEVLTLKTKLLAEGALGALMSGSGGVVFGICSDRRMAERVAVKLRHDGLWAQAVETLTISPAVQS